MAKSHKLISTIEQCKISSHFSHLPSLPLTFFDLLFLPFPPVQRIFFYEYSKTPLDFIEFDLPSLKHSLAITLHQYYPFAGLLSKGKNPAIIFSNTDFINFTVAISQDNFYELSANHAREMSKFHCLVPELDAQGEKTSVFAVQVTVFPNEGISIGTTVHHAVADGSTYTNFMKTWSSVHPKFPSFDRSLIHDSKYLESIYMKDLEMFSNDAWDMLYSTHDQSLMIRTFVFSKDLLSKLGSRTAMQCSPYALACGYIWSCLAKTRVMGRKKVDYFGFVTGCRPRHDPPLPEGYFGNCLGICCVEARSEDLTGTDGEVAAAEAIWKVIKGLEKGVFGNVENWMKNVCDYKDKNALTVAGSPKLGLYEVDFGWGRPMKVEIVSIERTGALSLAECRNEKGGIEVGLVLPRDQMEFFVSVFGNGLN